jgi:hypothetical protein
VAPRMLQHLHCKVTHQVHSVIGHAIISHMVYVHCVWGGGSDKYVGGEQSL